MARIRSVHPDITSSETMAHISARAERTFVRLWTHCDDDGRCRDNPKLLKAALFPLHDDVTAADVDADLDELESLVLRYEVDGKRYLEVRSWHQYQKPQRPTPSKLPKPSASTRGGISEHSEEAEGADGDLHAGVEVEREIGEGGDERTIEERVSQHPWGPTVTRDQRDGLLALSHEDLALALIETAKSERSYPTAIRKRVEEIGRRRKAVTDEILAKCSRCDKGGWVESPSGGVLRCTHEPE